MAEDSSRRSKGVVKWFNDQKGFGFITPKDGGEELFVHQSSIRSDGFRSLGDGEAVEFLIETGGDGRTKAVDVTGPNESPVQGSTRGGGGGDFGYNDGGRSRGSRGGGSGYGAGASRYRFGGNGGGSGGYGAGNVCFKCGEVGHIARDCYQGGGGGRRGGGRYGGSGGGGGSGCYNCGGEGHFARECPNSNRWAGGN